MSLHLRKPVLDEPQVDTRLLHERVLYRKDKPVISLNFRSSETSASGQPIFCNEAIIEGVVQLLGTKHVERVTFQGKGILTAPDLGTESVFWSSEEVFTGSHAWRFQLRLPAHVPVRTRGGLVQCPLPPSYRHQTGSATLQYHLAITASRGALRESYRLVVPFLYVPRGTPEYPLWRTVSSQDDEVTVEEGFVDISPIGPRSIPTGSFTEGLSDDSPQTLRQQSIQGTAFNRGVLVTIQARYNRPPYSHVTRQSESHYRSNRMMLRC